jgi:hypothetical protein
MYHAERMPLGSVRLAPIAPHEPVDAVPHSEDGKTCANERAGYAVSTTIVALIIVVLALVISATSQSRYGKSSKQCGSNN